MVSATRTSICDHIKYMYVPYLQSPDLVLHCFTGDGRRADPVYPVMWCRRPPVSSMASMSLFIIWKQFEIQKPW